MPAMPLLPLQIRTASFVRLFRPQSDFPRNNLTNSRAAKDPMLVELRGLRQAQAPSSSNPVPQYETPSPASGTGSFMVELRGFEPLTPSMRTRCATGLRYSPRNLNQSSKRYSLTARAVSYSG